MQERTMRLAIAVILTAADVATFNWCSGVIWQAWGQDPWLKVVLLALLSLWIASAVVIWRHISNDARQTFRERNLALSRNHALSPQNPRREPDV